MMLLGVEVGLGPGDIVLDGDPAAPKKCGTAPQFLAHVCCGQMAGWIKMPLGTEVGLVSHSIVLDRKSAPHGKGHSSPHFLTDFALAWSPISATAVLL